MYVIRLGHFLANFLYPFILTNMLSLFGFCFCGVVLSRFFEWDPVWRSEQRPELFEVGQDLTSDISFMKYRRLYFVFIFYAFTIITNNIE